MFYFPDRRAGQIRDCRQRRLRRVQTEPEIRVRVRREHIGRLMPLRIPAGADLRAALVLADADRGHDIHERRRVRVRHVTADGRRIVGRVFFVRLLEHPRERLRLRRPSSSSPGTRR